MRERFGTACVQLTTSCTSALEVAALLCDLAPDDEVIMPSYTFVSTANAFWFPNNPSKWTTKGPATMPCPICNLASIICGVIGTMISPSAT